MRHLATILYVLIATLLVGCGGHSSRQPRSISPLAVSSGTYEDTLNLLPDDIRADVDGLAPPNGCSVALYYALKKSFVNALVSRLSSGDKLASVAPSGGGNIVHGLTVNPSGPDFILQWNYHNTGDYDQNGTVGITDITPIAMHYGHTIGTDGLDGVIHDVTPPAGAVGISDITPIAMNYGVSCDHYRVESSPDGVGTWSALGDVPLFIGTGGDEGWKQFQYTLPDALPRWLRVVPADALGNDGVPSDSLQFGGGSPPVIDLVSPLFSAIGSSVQFSAVVSGVGPFTYEWSFNGAATPNSSSDEQPTVTLSSATGDYNCSLVVASAAGTDTYDFVLGIGIPPTVNAVAPLGGISGDSVQFTVDASGATPFTYAWDFGGAATPGSSAEESPTVTLNAPGIYDTASVTVTNPYGESFFGFTITVTAAPTVPDITAVAPTTGEEMTQVTMNATVSGAPPITYSWDFGTAATPNTSTDAAPLIILGMAGTYPCSLEVQNSYGTDTFNFDLIITPATDYDEVEVNDTILQANALPAFPVLGWHCRLTETSDVDDFFSFNVAFADQISVTMQLDADDPNLDIELQDALGAVLSASSGTTDQEHLTYMFKTAGTYYLRCYYAGHTAVNAGDYWLSITVTPNTMD